MDISLKHVFLGKAESLDGKASHMEKREHE